MACFSSYFITVTSKNLAILRTNCQSFAQLLSICQAIMTAFLKCNQTLININCTKLEFTEIISNIISIQ